MTLYFFFLPAAETLKYRVFAIKRDAAHKLIPKQQPPNVFQAI